MSQKEKPDSSLIPLVIATCHFLESLNLQHWTRIGAVFARNVGCDVDVGCGCGCCVPGDIRARRVSPREISP